MIAVMSGESHNSHDKHLQSGSVDPGDLALIDDMLALTPEERLRHLEQTLRSLEALLAATGTAIPAE